MKTALGPLIVLIVGCATGAAVRDLVVPAPAAAVTTRPPDQIGSTYEYSTTLLRNIHFGGNGVQTTLNQYAKTGWRLANTISVSEGMGAYLIFERQIENVPTSAPR
jgi:hypothetical protein